MELNSTELEKAIQRITAPGFFICHCESRAPMSEHSDDLRATTVGYLLSFEPELIQVVTAGGLTLSLRFPP